MKRVRLLGHLGGGGAAGADRPDRLVGDRQLDRSAEPPRAGRRDLALQHLLGLARLALLLALAHARITSRPACRAAASFSASACVGLAEVLAPLGVAQQHAVHAQVGQHRRRDLAGERALRRLVHVLRVDPKRGARRRSTAAASAV